MEDQPNTRSMCIETALALLAAGVLFYLASL
jgi:hypothetical protein